MSRKGQYLLWCGLVIGSPLILLGLYRVTAGTPPEGPRPPELAGRQVPAKVFEIGFDRRYDLFCSAYADTPLIYRDCKILGFTGRGEDASKPGRPSGSFSLSSPSGSYPREYFDHWLVLELSDGRQAYISPANVKYIEQAAPPGR